MSSYKSGGPNYFSMAELDVKRKRFEVELEHRPSKESYELNSGHIIDVSKHCVKCDGFLLDFEEDNKICTPCSVKQYESAGTL